MSEGTQDRLEGLRASLEGLDEVALDDRPEVFEDINEALVAELTALEEL